jgi:hypothetical protein
MTFIVGYVIWYLLTRTVGFWLMRRIEDSRKRQEAASLVLMSLVPVYLEIASIALGLMFLMEIAFEAAIIGYGRATELLAGGNSDV